MSSPRKGIHGTCLFIRVHPHTASFSIVQVDNILPILLSLSMHQSSRVSRDQRLTPHRYYHSQGGSRGPSALESQLDAQFDSLRGMLQDNRDDVVDADTRR